MQRSKRFPLDLTDEEFEKLKAYAASKDVSMAHILREYIKRLPNLKKDENLST